MEDLTTKLSRIIDKDREKSRELDIFYQNGLYEREIDERSVLTYWKLEEIRDWTSKAAWISGLTVAGAAALTGTSGLIEKYGDIYVSDALQGAGVFLALCSAAFWGASLTIDLATRYIVPCFSSSLDHRTYSNMKKAVKKGLLSERPNL